MKTFAINTIGCKVNQYESQQIRQLLEQLGLMQIDIAEDPDLVVINTCCVTRTASAKSRQHLHKAQKLNPAATVVVAGCLPAVQIDELNIPDKNTHIIKYREVLADTLTQLVKDQSEKIKPTTSNQQNIQIRCNNIIKLKNDHKIKPKNKLTNLPKLPQLTSFKGHTRAFLKIQDGCDAHCTYCIIPKTRPAVSSKPAHHVLAEAQSLVKAGHKEIVLTGVFLGAYGRETVRRKLWPDGQNDKLPQLLEELAEIPGLARIRLSSLEPADVTPRLLDAFCKYPNIMPHLHLSLQSGSGSVLKRMARQYQTQDFTEAIELIKSRLDRPAITTDFIVGFPGETDADFEQTVALAKEAGFAKMHVFSFSPRKGTVAADMQPAIETKIIKQRSQILRDLDAELGCKFRRQFIGQTITILIENCDPPVQGRAERYFMVTLKDPDQNCKKNELIRARLTENNYDSVTGLPL